MPSLLAQTVLTSLLEVCACFLHPAQDPRQVVGFVSSLVFFGANRFLRTLRMLGSLQKWPSLVFVVGDGHLNGRFTAIEI